MDTLHMTYSEQGLRRLGAALVAREKPNTKNAATAMLKMRLGAYLSDATVIDTVVKQRFSKST